MLRIVRPVRAWLRTDRAPTEREQRAVLLLPAHELLVHAALWAIAAVAFTVINLQDGWRLALVVALSTGLGGAATCAVAYLVAQRVLRPVTARALAEHVPEEPALPGIAARLLLTWAVGTGVPVLGLALLGAGELTGVLDAPADRVAAGAVALGGIALSSGWSSRCSPRNRWRGRSRPSAAR